MLIRAGASSKYLTDPTRIREANQIARVVLMNSIPSAPKQKKRQDLTSLHPVQSVFGCVLDQLSRTALNSAKHGSQRKVSSTLVVPDVVYQCSTYIREFGIRTQGVFRIPGDMGVVKRLKNLYNTQNTVNLREELGGMCCYHSLYVITHTHTHTHTYIHTGHENEIPKEKLADRVMTVATLIKCFFRELQKPLITVGVMSDLQDIVLPVLKKMRKEETDKVEPKTFEAIRVVLALMGECNLLCLRYVTLCAYPHLIRFNQQ
ncbi:hypothetical protein OAV88_03485 [bacterium]|nr:hypothetical protein [bacterium]